MAEKKLIPFLLLVFSFFFVSYSSAAEIHFQWGTSSGGVEGYKIYYGSSHGGPYPNLLAQVGSTTTDYLTTGLNEEETYYLVVRAYNDYGESGNSNEVIVEGGSQPNPEIIPISFDEMTLVYVDSEETRGEDGRGINAIDGNPSTMWHTEWSANNPVHPHEIVIDLGYERQVCGFNYLPRQGGSYNGGIAEYEFYVSIDSENWGSPVASGIFPSTKAKQEVVFYPKYARYVKLVALSEINGHPWTSAAEIEVMEQIGGHANIAPNAVIHTDVTSGYIPLTVQFDASGSSDPDGVIVNCQWNFGDGESDIGEAVGHTFQTTGEYTVTLTVEDNEGATAQAQITITVGGHANIAPNAVIHTDVTSGYIPLTVQFDASGSSDPDGVIVNCQWNFGDGESDIGEAVGHTFQTTGEYTVTLTVEDNEGATAQAQITITVGGHANIAPNAVIHTDVTSGYVPLTVQFDASGSSDPDGGIVSYQWNFGDGESDIGEAVGHTFQTTGEYTVTLTVEDNEGATAQAQITITVEEESAEVTLIPYSEMTLVYVDSEEPRGENGGINAIDGNPSTMWHTEWYANNPVHPHEIVIDLGYERQVCGFNYLPRQGGSYNGGIAEYEFYVSVDSENWGSPVASGIFPYTKTKQEVVFYPKYARYVKLVALSEVNGNPWTSAAEIEVMEQIGGHANIAPNAVIHTDVTSGYVPLTVQFDASGSSDPDGGIVSYQWNFGDGESDIGEAVGHTFQTTGEYTVTLTVEDNEGATAQAQITITVGGHANIAPNAVIHTDVTSGYVPLTVQFDASGSSDPDGGIVSYQWNFGDGESDIGEVVWHTFQTTGEYTVTLTVEDNEGATAQAQITITVEEESAEVTLIPYSEMTLVYVDSEEPRGENGGINAIDGNPSTMWHTEWYANDPVHPHEIVIDLGYERQVCGFNYLPRQGGSYNGGIAEYEFYVSVDSENWGSPVASGIFPYTKTKQEVVFYPKYARYVKLVALSEVNGNPWTSAAEIEVMEQIGGHANIAPNAVIHTDVTSGYVPLTVQFDASGSSDPDGGIVSYQWNFGDGESDIGEAVGHTFQTTGEYTVTLTVEDNEGATAQAQITITVEEESAEVTLIPYSEMTLVYVDSEETYRGDGRGINAIDGNPSTMWHTEWYANDPVHPHEIVIDLGYERQVCGFNYLPRQGGSYNGGIAEYEFYVSIDSENWGSPVASGIFPRTKTKQEVVFYPKDARYVKLVAFSEIKGHPWTSAAEIEVMER